MKILIATDWGNSPHNTGQALTWAFRQIPGLEICSCGPTRGTVGTPDILVPDRPHPEMYSYEEVLARAPWTPDLILQIEPGFFLCGKKPKNIKSAFYFTDSHCAGILEVRAHEWGQFDYLFVGQPAYYPIFADLAPTVRLVLPAFDERRFSYDEEDTEPVCDISFVGHSGLKLPGWEYVDGENICGQDDCGRYFTNPFLSNLEGSVEKYDGQPPSYDYAERAELLYRLMKDFSVRIYEPIWDGRIQGALRKGRIGFNRSLLGDFAIRICEYAAAGRHVVTDAIVGNYGDYISYPLGMFYYPGGLHRPFYENFNTTYGLVRRVVGKFLDLMDDPYIEEVRQHIRNDAFKFHTWTQRAREIMHHVSR